MLLYFPFQSITRVVRNEEWRTVLFYPLLTSLNQTDIGIKFFLGMTETNEELGQLV